MQRTELASLYKATPADGTKVTVCGWAKTVRDSKNIGFISLSDGSCYKPVQIVFQADKLANSDGASIDSLRRNVRNSVSNLFWNKTHTRPMVIPVVLEV